MKFWNTNYILFKQDQGKKQKKIQLEIFELEHFKYRKIISQIKYNVKKSVINASKKFRSKDPVQHFKIQKT